jgi:imidazolonepropionase-like amidohydrolase/Tol biopolymer transport system component
MPAAGGPARRLPSPAIAYFLYASPAWAPDNHHVAYASAGALVVLDVDGGGERVVRIDGLPASPRPRNNSPAWSSDGTRMAFVNTASSPVRGDGLIWEVAADGGTARPLTKGPGLAPVWSPDGSRLAFLARDAKNQWQVWVQSADGVARSLTHHDDVVTFRVRWTPDGRDIVYSADGGLWRVSIEGGEPTRIPFRARVTFARERATLRPVRFPEPGSNRVAKGFTSLAISPDARRIAILALDTLWIGDAGARPRADATAPRAGDNILTWSSDGQHLAWTQRERPGRPFDLVATNATTGERRVLAALGQDIDAALWSPDGKWIAVFTGGHLRLVDPAGPTALNVDQTRDLGTATAAWGTASWSPGSDAIVVATQQPPGELGAFERAQSISLDGTRKDIERFPQLPSNLRLFAGGYAMWIEHDLLWRAPFDASSGLAGSPVKVSDEPAVEARFASDGTALFLSSSGLRLRDPNGAVRDVPWPLQYSVRSVPPPLLIRGARVIDGRGSPLSQPSDVLVRDGRIVRIAPAGSIEDGRARVIDARGRYLVPGLIDLHAHIWEDVSLLAWLHNGVTTVRDIASQRVKTLDLRNMIEAGLREGPRIVYAGAMFHHGQGFSTVSNQMVSDPADIARGMAINAGMGAEYTKERGFQDWQRSVTIVRESHRFGMPVSGHCEHILPVVAAGVDGAEHVLDCFRDRTTMRDDYVALARASGEWIVPTAALRLSFVRVIDDPALLEADDVAPFLTPQYRPAYGTDAAAQRGRPALLASVQRLEVALRRYHEAGVLLATGTDSPFPLGVQHELEALVESGLSPAEALVAATSGAARVLNAPEIGAIAPGQWADLLLLDANPLDDIRNTRRIVEVIQGGRIIDRERLRRDGIR